MDYCEAYWTVLNLKEEKERRRKVFKAMLMRERELASAPPLKFCPKCHMQLTEDGRCVNGCDD